MNKHMKSITVVLGMSLIFSLFGCGETIVTSSSSSSSSSSLSSHSYLVLDGISEYKVAIPDSPSATVSYAASELSTYLNEATGATLPIVSESDIVAGDLYISLGKNSLSDALSLDVASLSLGTSGYLLKTIEERIYILGSENTKDEGVLNGVYDVLEDAIGFRAYSSDEVDYELKEDVPLYDYDLVEKPSFDVRSIGYRSLMDDEGYRRKMKIIDQYSDERWGLYGHSLASALVPVSTLYDEHPSWFTSKSLESCQLNYLAGDELVTYCANSLISIIQSKPEAQFFMMGQEDNNNFPSGTAVDEALSNWAGSMQGLQIAFCNQVIEKVETWRTANAPSRDITYVIFAYMATLDAPVKKDESGNYVAYSDRVIPSEKLSIYFTPIGTDFSKPLTDKDNLGVYESLQGYKALAYGQIMVYIYDINFSNYFINFNNLGTISSIYQTFLDAGVYYLYTQGPLDTVTSSLEQLRIYVESRLMWDVTLSVGDLVDDFITHYYGPAADSMSEYYSTTFDRYAIYCGETGESFGSIYSSLNQKALWTEEVVDSFDRSLSAAKESILPLKENSESKYDKIYLRIEKEYLTVLFLQLSNYTVYLSDEEKSEKKEEFFNYCREFHITRQKENGNINGLFSSL